MPYLIAGPESRPHWFSCPWGSWKQPPRGCLFGLRRPPLQFEVRQYGIASERKLSFAPESACIHWVHPAGCQAPSGSPIELHIMSMLGSTASQLRKGQENNAMTKSYVTTEGHHSNCGIKIFTLVTTPNIHLRWFPWICLHLTQLCLKSSRGVWCNCLLTLCSCGTYITN